MKYMESCPRCQCETFFVRLVQRYDQHYYFDGSVCDAGEFYHVRGGMVAYCSECELRLGQVVGDDFRPKVEARKPRRSRAGGGDQP